MARQTCARPSSWWPGGAQERSAQPNQAVIIDRGDFYKALDDIGKGETTPKLVKHLQWAAGMLLDLVEQAPGAMASPEPGRFRFLHLSFQEYLAACDMLYRPGTAYARGRRCPGMTVRFLMSLVAQVRQKPRLWANVLRLAVDELLAKGRVPDAWELLALCCQPYQATGDSAPGAQLALQVTLNAGLFQTAPPWGSQHCYRTLCDAARRALADHTTDNHAGLTPEEARTSPVNCWAATPSPATTRAPAWASRTTCRTSSGSRFRTTALGPTRTSSTSRWTPSGLPSIPSPAPSSRPSWTSQRRLPRSESAVVARAGSAAGASRQARRPAFRVLEPPARARQLV